MTFMVGLVQTISGMQQSGKGPPLFCIDPRAVSPKTVRERAARWLQGHESRLNEQAYILVSEALHQACLCQCCPAEPEASLPRRDTVCGANPGGRRRRVGILARGRPNWK